MKLMDCTVKIGKVKFPFSDIVSFGWDRRDGEVEIITAEHIKGETKHAYAREITYRVCIDDVEVFEA